MKSPSLEVLSIKLEMVPGNLLQLTLDLQKCLPNSALLWPSVVQPTCTAAVIQHPICVTFIHLNMLSIAYCCNALTIKYKKMTKSLMVSKTPALVPFNCLLIQKYKEVDAVTQIIINISRLHELQTCNVIF